jgi:hypothetical protein
VFIASSLAAGLYAVAIVVVSRSLRDTWINLQLLWLRLLLISRHFGAEDRLEKEVQRTDRRLRVIPFAAMVAVGLISTLIWLRLTAR